MAWQVPGMIGIPGFEPPAMPAMPTAHGQIVGRRSPITAHRGETITISAAVKNTANMTDGNFILVLMRGTSEVSRVNVGNVFGSFTSGVKTMSVTAPMTGESVTYTLECRRV